MYFLGTLEKILEGTSKVEPEVAVKKKEYIKKLYVKEEYDKPYVKKESPSYTKEKIRKNSYSEKESKRKPNNCYLK